MTRIAAAATILLGLAAPAFADTPARIRGTVVGVEGNVLTVKPRGGDLVTPTSGDNVQVRLADDWSANAVVKATIADIKPGVFVGVASAPKGEDTTGLEALELVVFPESMRGVGEGHFPWDLQPNSQMTNATVASQVEDVKGRTLTLSYKGGEKKITLPANVPIVTLTNAAKEDVKAGANVFVPAQKKDDGSIQASRVLVGKDGLVPPM